MKNIKIVCFLLCLGLVFALCACGSEAKTATAPEITPVPTPEPTPEPTPIPTVTVLGTSYEVDVTELDLQAASAGDVPELCARLPEFLHLEHLSLPSDPESELLSLADITAISAAAPDAQIDCAFELFGQIVSSSDTELDYENVPIGNDGAEIVRQALPFLGSCSRMVLADCGIDNDVLAQLRSDFPATKIVWKIYVTGYGQTAHGHYTDIERIRTTDFTNAEAELFKYFEDVKYVDIGHRKKMTNFEWLSYMPHLQVLIVSLTDFGDEHVQYLQNCHELEFLEMFTCQVTDLTPLAECTSIEYLNIGNLKGITDITPLYGLTNLKHLRICQDNVPQEQKDEITRLLPDCYMDFYGGHPGFSGRWRYDENGKNTERYQLLREQFDYDEWPWANWAW